MRTLRFAAAPVFVLSLLAACAPPVEDAATDESAQTTAPCGATLAMDGASSPDAWQGLAHDGWGEAASQSAEGGMLRLSLARGNDGAKLVLPASASLRPGTYALESVRARVVRRDGSCATDPGSTWAEVGLASASDVALDAPVFSPTIKQALASACTASRFAPRRADGGKLTAELSAGGALTVAVKVGSTGEGIVADFDDVALTCVAGSCMECSSEGDGPEPPASGCQKSGAVEACPSSITVAQSFSVSRSNGDRQSYASPSGGTTTHETVVISNDAGVALTFLKTAMGARLYSARVSGKEMLYQNPSPRVQGNWGQGGFPIFGGVESAWPVEEHGYYGNLDWASRVDASVPGRISFVATGQGKSASGSPATVTITTTLEARATSWRQRVEVAGTPGAENMYYTNMMIDAGRVDQPADIEVIVPGLTRAQVHSRSGEDGFLPGEHGEFDWPVHAGRDVSHMNTTIKGWLGMFVNDAAPRSKTYGFFDHTKGLGLAVVAADAEGFFPKFFCGHRLTADASGSGKGYCEMWFSPNARTFWDHPVLPSSGKLVHEVRIVPFFSRAGFDAATR